MSDPNAQQFYAPPPPPAPESPAPRPINLRVPAIVLFVLGLLILGAGIPKIIPGGIVTGLIVALTGMCVFGLSFVPLPPVTPDAPAPMSALQRITGIFYEPSAVFRNLRRHPRWLAALLVIAFVNIGYGVAFAQRLTPERIVDYLTEKMAQTPLIPPEAVERAKVEQLEQLKNPVQRVQTAVKSISGLFLLNAFLAALFMLAVLVFGGKINYWQSFVVMVYAALPVTVVQKLISFLILYIKSPDDIHPLRGQETLVQDNLGFLFSPSDHPVLFVAASWIGVLSFYALWLRATGLRYSGERVSSTAAWGAAILFWVLGLVLSLALAALFPAFIG
jgi:hypothetical protein